MNQRSSNNTPSRYKQVLIGLAVSLYFSVHGIFAVGIMPAPLQQGGFQLCHQNLATQQLIALSQNARGDTHHAHADIEGSTLTAESACDIGFFLDQWFNLNNNSWAFNVVTKINVSQRSAAALVVTAHHALSQPRAPPFSSN